MFKKILVTLDGSELAERALPVGVELAQFHDAELLLLRVAEGEPTLAEKAVGYTWIGAEQRIEEDSAEAQAYLEQIVADLPENALSIATHVAKGDGKAEIVRFAKKHDIDVIVMSTHGRTGLPNLIMGSVAEGVIGNAPCPVMLIRAGL